MKKAGFGLVNNTYEALSSIQISFSSCGSFNTESTHSLWRVCGGPGFAQCPTAAGSRDTRAPRELTSRGELPGPRGPVASHTGTRVLEAATTLFALKETLAEQCNGTPRREAEGAAPSTDGSAGRKAPAWLPVGDLLLQSAEAALGSCSFQRK